MRDFFYGLLVIGAGFVLLYVGLAVLLWLTHRLVHWLVGPE